MKAKFNEVRKAYGIKRRISNDAKIVILVPFAFRVVFIIFINIIYF